MSENNGHGELTFDDLSSLEPVEHRFEYGGKKYVLLEADGTAATRYKSAVIRALRQNADGTATPTDALPETDPQLVADCLYYAAEDGSLPRKDGNPDRKKLVPVAAVKAFPNQLFAFLTDQAKRVGRLGVYEDNLDQLKKLRDYAQKRIDELTAGQDPKN